MIMLALKLNQNLLSHILAEYGQQQSDSPQVTISQIVMPGQAFLSHAEQSEEPQMASTNPRLCRGIN